MHVIVAGGSGFVGRRLCATLLSRGDRVTVLTRDPGRASQRLPTGVALVRWDPREGPRPAWIRESADALVNLCGESIAGGRWTPSRKELLSSSRLVPTRALVEALRLAAGRPRVLLNASAIGYYGNRKDQELIETDAAGHGFLSDLCVRWEAAAQPAAELGMRLVLLRVGVVLSSTGGAMERILTPFKAYVGGPLGSGRQWFSWIHLHDAVRLLLHALDTPGLSGPVNCTSPEPETNEVFSGVLAEVMERPCALRVPEPFLRLAMGEMACVVLDSTRVVPKAALQSGFEFRFPALREALADVIAGA